MTLTNTPRLETERLVLRKFRASNLEALLRLFGDQEINEYLPWFVLNNVSEARVFYEQHYERRYEKETGYHYAICFKPDDTPIG